MSLIKKIFLISFLVLIFISVFSLFFEQVQAEDPWDLGGIKARLEGIIALARGLAPILGGAMIAIAGMMFIFSAAQPEGIAKARAALLAAGIGIMIIAGADAIIRWFKGLF